MRENRTRSTAIGATVPLRMLPLRSALTRWRTTGSNPCLSTATATGTVDLYVANDTDPNLLLRNLGNGRFKDVSLATGASHSADGEEQAGMGVAAGDYDNDGDCDFFVTHFSEDYYTLYRSEGGRLFTDVSHAAGVGEVSMPFVGWGTGFFDRDNDGDLDLFAANGHVYPGPGRLRCGHAVRPTQFSL